MKVAIINEPWNGGASRCAADLMAGLASQHEIFHFPESADSSAGEVEEWLAKIAPDIVHLHSFYGWLPYDRLRIISQRYRTVFTPHDPRPIGQIDPTCYQCQENRWCLRCPLVSRRRWALGHPYLLSRLKKRWVHYRAAANLQVVAVSQWLLKRMQAQEMKRFGMWHIPNGIDTSAFQHRPHARAALGLPESAEILLFLSSRGPRWEANPNKGMVNLAEVFVEQIAPARPNAILAVAGEWVVPNHPQVRGLGYIPREQLPLWYSAASLYVLPTQGDNFPYTVLEAMACECPVVATDIGGLREQVVEGVTGRLVPKGDGAALAGALNDLLSNRSAREMGVAGRERVLRHFTLETFLRKHADLYATLAGEPAGSADLTALPALAR